MQIVYVTHKSLLKTPEEVLRANLYPAAYLPDGDDDKRFRKALGFSEPILEAWGERGGQLISSTPNDMPNYLWWGLERPINCVWQLETLEGSDLVLVLPDGEVIPPRDLIDAFKVYRDAHPLPKDFDKSGIFYGMLEYGRDYDGNLVHHGHMARVLHHLARFYRDAPSLRDAVVIEGYKGF